MTQARTSEPGWRELGSALAVAARYRPLVLATAALLLGMVWADQVRATPVIPVILGLSGLLLAVVAARWAPLSGLAFVLCAAFLLGAGRHAARITPASRDLVQVAGQVVPQMPVTVTRVLADNPDWPLVVVRAEFGAYRGLAAVALPAFDPAAVPEVGDEMVLAEVTLWRAGEGELRSHALPEPRRLAREGIHTVARAGRVLSHGSPPSVSSTARDGALALNRRMLRALCDAMPGSNPGTYSRLLASMVYGNRAAPVPGHIWDLFKASGTVHLLVVSGAQVSILALTFVFLLRGRRRAMPLWTIPLVAGGLLAFAFVSGLGASVSRAVAMQLLLLCSFAWGRGYDLPTALALAALGLCLTDPAALFEVGPQLTYACTIGVCLAAAPPRRDDDARTVANPLLMVVWGSLGAWLFSLPVLAGHFSAVVLLGALANLVAVPLSVILLYLGLLGIALGMVWTPLAIPCCFLARGAMEVLLRSNQFFAAMPGAVMGDVTVTPWHVVAWYACATALLVGLRWDRRSSETRPARWPWALAAGSVAAGAILVALALRPPPRPELQLHLLDVGAGQCLLARSPDGTWVMLDGGVDPTVADPGEFARVGLLGYMALRGIRRLEAVVISHAHTDHFGMVPTVLREVPVGQLLIGPDLGADAAWRRLLETAQEVGLRPLPAQAGGGLSIGGSVRLDILEPTGLLRHTDEDANNNNLVLRLTYGAVSILLPGDLQAEGEARLLQDYAARPETLRSAAMLASHHGSRHSNTEAFVGAISPEVVLLTRGWGSNAPRPDSLEAFQRRGLPVWQSGSDGVLLLRTDGKTVRVEGRRWGG